MVELNAFEQWVDQAIAGLPGYFRERMDNVAIAVEDWADRETLRVAGLRRPEELLGFYHGIPLTKNLSQLKSYPTRMFHQASALRRRVLALIAHPACQVSSASSHRSHCVSSPLPPLLSL
jgi:predicted Zn-dependent protease with MMP-like domain